MQQGGKPKIAAALIAGDGITESDWDRCLSSLKPHVDHIFLAFNGKEPLAIPNSFGDGTLSIGDFEWEDDFAKARTQSFDMVPKDQYDWILWIDLDDTLESDGTPLAELISSLDENTQSVFLRYDYAVDPDTEKVVVEQWRERLFRTDGVWRWKYPLHEICHGQPGTQYSRKHEFWVRHWREAGAENDHATRERNRRIIGKAMEREPHEPRHTFYMAGELFAEADEVWKHDREQAEPLLRLTIQLYNQFMEMSPWADDTYVANHRTAECYRMLGDHNRAIDIDLQGIKVLPSWPDSYLGIARSYMEERDWEKMRDWARLCLFASSKPETTQVVEPLNMDYIPNLLVGIAEQELGNVGAAREHYERASTVFCPPELSERIAKLEGQEATETHSGVGGPSEQRRSLRGARPERSIAFCTRPLFEPWHPELERQGGAGGAETCIMRLAPRFAEDGYRVAVFGTPGEFKGVDSTTGVEWWESSEFDTQEPFTAVVASRAPEVFDAKVAASQKYLWLHDVNLGEDAFRSEWGDRYSRVDNIICLTEWHRSHTARLYGLDPKKIAIIPNGIDISKFRDADSHDRQAGKFVYGSSPDRGLDNLLSCWPRIREAIPDATLNIYYGWEAIDKIVGVLPAGHPQREFLCQFKSGIERMLDKNGREDGGIFWRGRVPQWQLAQEYMTADMWLYPTAFLETFCITALEAQAAGMIPCTSSIGALQETVAVKGQLLGGHAANFDYQDRFVDLVDRTYHAGEETKQGWRKQGRGLVEKFSWDEVYLRWKSLIESRMPQKVLASA